MVTSENIVKTYHGAKALEYLSFNVDRGEIFGFIGPDGAGKTSLFRILTSLILPDRINFLLSKKLRSILSLNASSISSFEE